MQRTKRLLIGAGCALLLFISWMIAVTAKTDVQKQAELLEQARTYMEDEIYILPVPLLEEAAAYQTDRTGEAEALLKECYLQLIDQSGYRRKYTSLLDRQMSREDPTPEIFLEAAEYYLSAGKYAETFDALVKGIEKTDSALLKEFYESVRYEYRIDRTAYEDVTAFYNHVIQVKLEGAWGLADADKLLIPCIYDQISTYDGRAIARKGGAVIAVDRDNNRVALLHDPADAFGNYGGNRVALHKEGGWFLADGDFHQGSIAFESLGMYSEGYAAAQMGGKWGVVDARGTDWLIPAEYDGIIVDELGRCCGQKAVFVKKGGQVLLFVNGEQLDGVYEDARPFADGWAAVKRNGKWGFIDTEGQVRIDFQFDDALSFGQHLAAIRSGDAWGYISREGRIVIEPAFLAAKSFSNGVAPVQTERGWQFLKLKEYE